MTTVSDTDYDSDGRAGVGLAEDPAQGVDEELHDSAELREQWRREQARLKQQLVLDDAFAWSVDSVDDGGGQELRLVAGVDISFVEDSLTEACAALVVMEFPSLKVLHEDYEMVELVHPYIAGYLAFREVPFLERMLNKLRREHPELAPQVVMADGNGILHHRGFGVACHLGVLCDIPTIGVAKNLLCIDGLERKPVEAECREKLLHSGDTLPLVGASGTVWGVALRSTEKASKQVYVSPGHRISLETAVKIVHRCCEYRIPAPVRAADLGSREVVRQYVHDQLSRKGNT